MIEYVCMNCGQDDVYDPDVHKTFRECRRCGSLDLVRPPLLAEYNGEPLSLETPSSDDPWKHQEGGGHYKSMPIQPAEYCQKNRLNHMESSIVKYASRHQHKNGAEDVRKIIHYAKLLLALEYPDEDNEL